MLSNADLKTVLTTNFDDIRCTSILLFLRDLLERKKHGGGIEQYRVTNTTTGTAITTVDEFIAALDETALTMSYYRFSEKMSGDRIHPFCVIPENFQVSLDSNSDEDANYTVSYGFKASKIMFLVNYLSDTDPALPLKVFEIRLV